jgi:hypothetical protein
MPSKEVHDLIIGKLLGDAYADKRSHRHNTRIEFKHSNKQKDFIKYIWSILYKNDFCSIKFREGVINMEHLPNRNSIANYIAFRTYSIPWFNVYRNMFYNKNKIIPLN